MENPSSIWSLARWVASQFISKKKKRKKGRSAWLAAPVDSSSQCHFYYEAHLFICGICHCIRKCQAGGRDVRLITEWPRWAWQCRVLSILECAESCSVPNPSHSWIARPHPTRRSSRWTDVTGFGRVDPTNSHRGPVNSSKSLRLLLRP